MAASTRPVAAALFGTQVPPGLPARSSLEASTRATARRAERWSALFNRSFAAAVTRA